MTSSSPSALHPIRRWLLAHRGILSRVAKDHDVSPQYVQRIVWGGAWDSRKRVDIEKSLRAEGWPSPNKTQDRGTK